MKKRHWLFTLMLIAVLLVTAAPSPAKAQNPAPLTPERARRAAQQRLDTEVQAGRAPGWAGAALNDPVRLDDLSGTASAFLFPVSRNDEPAGYLTVAAIELPNPVLEFATEGGFPLSTALTTVAESAAETGYALKNGQPLYLGLLNYAYELAPVAETELLAAATDHYHVMFRGRKHVEKVGSGFQSVFSVLCRESQAKSGIDFLEINRSKQPF